MRILVCQMLIYIFICVRSFILQECTECKKVFTLKKNLIRHMTFQHRDNITSLVRSTAFSVKSFAILKVPYQVWNTYLNHGSMNLSYILDKSVLIKCIYSRNVPFALKVFKTKLI